MIGRIQRNKARAVADWAYAAHSVDGVALVVPSAAPRRQHSPRRADRSRWVSTFRSASTGTRIAAAWTSAVHTWSTKCAPLRIRRTDWTSWGSWPSRHWTATPTKPSRVWLGNESGYRPITNDGSGCRRGCPAISSRR
jgi:hypothetical protein